MSSILLHTPEGVRDIYGEELYRKKHVEDALHGVVSSYGYEDIVTPTFEFFDVFSKEVGTTPSKELYKFFDKENNTLVLRPDFTPSIARCAAKYFMEQDQPLRLSYLGSSFTRISSLQGKLTETTEMGAELIGDASVYADAELIALSIEGLLKIGLNNFRVSIGHVDYFKGICEAAGLDEETEGNLRRLISGKNYFAAEELIEQKNISSPHKEKLLQIADTFSDQDTLAAARENVSNQRSLAAIERLEKLYQVLTAYGYEKYISFDLSMLNKYNYYTGVIFRVYTYGVGRPIVKGGRYDSLLHSFGKNAPAIGFVFLVDDILEAMISQKISFTKPEQAVTLTYNASEEGSYQAVLKEAISLRAKGKKVIINSAN